MKDQKKENDLLYIDHRGELLIWLIIILIIVAVCSLFNIKKILDKDNYSIFLPDVDGLIVGSPVRIMGIDVGHITKIEPMKEEVFVQFILKNKDITLPRGTQATVEFSGMAGSKSLELYIPEEDSYVDNNTPMLIGTQPKRLSDVYSLLNEMFRTVGNIISTTSVFAKHIREIEMPVNENPQNLNMFLKYANDAIDLQQKRVDEFGRKVRHE